MEKREFLNYFVWNGVKYYTGTVIVVKDMGRPVEAAFVCYDKTYNRYVYKIKDWQCSVYPKQFEELLVEVTDKRNNKVHMPVVKTLKDSQIEGLFLGWMWYIFLMAVIESLGFLLTNNDNDVFAEMGSIPCIPYEEW